MLIHTNSGICAVFSRLSWGKENRVPDKCSWRIVDRHGARRDRSSIHRKVWRLEVDMFIIWYNIDVRSFTKKAQKNCVPQLISIGSMATKWTWQWHELFLTSGWSDAWVIIMNGWIYICHLGWPSLTRTTLWKKGWFTGISVSWTKTPVGILERRRSSLSNVSCARSPSQRSAWKSLWSTATSAMTRHCLCRSWWAALGWPKKKVSLTTHHNVYMHQTSLQTFILMVKIQ